ncbi:hypothetical protein LWI28_022320 [Acer negundo]|uniref:Uncharacterized protein n=1 Tax=Acer negundo TaxID=4023 RepID=A0AAD5NNZ7_ACENE|nr:hypothetical protein LWI28_022320 [Acer negundo]KAK4844774.1 hypothetical protein QYF36_024304 [Acer negundo]
MKSFLRGWALAITPRDHLTCGIGGWVIGFCFVDILTVGKHHALSCPDIQNWCPEWCLCIKNISGWSQNRLFFSNSSYNGGWIDLLCAEALLYVLGR